MLFLTRKIGQAIIINDDIQLQVIDVSGKTVKLGFQFPKTARVLRQELYEKIQSENVVAAQTVEEVREELVENFKLEKKHKQAS